MRKLLLTLPALLLSFLISSCATPPDVPVCVELNPTKGWCTNTISEKEFFLDEEKNLFNGKKWSEVNLTSVRVPAASWAQLKSYILKQCKKNQDCQSDLGKWQRKTDSVDKKIKGDKP